MSIMQNVMQAECRKLALYAEYRYAECYYAECRGAFEPCNLLPVQ